MPVTEIIIKVLSVLGALGLFLFGMKLMSEALQKVAGEKMRRILSSLTSNKFRSLFTGILITATIQSSSATTVVIVSFVNAGLISLGSAIAVIMGANIGTSITAWIVSIFGFASNFNIIYLPLMGIAFPMYFSKNQKLKLWGEMIFGFAILFTGIEFMKNIMPDVETSHALYEFLSVFAGHGFLSIILFVVIGFVVTSLLQSSSATMALTLVMCYKQLIPFELGAAMILGENIGTTITANLAAIVTNNTAKRAARSHLIFNIIGAIWLLMIFRPFLNGIDHLVFMFTGESLLSSQGIPQENSLLYPIGLSLFHSAYNIINTLLLIWFIPQIEKLTLRLISKPDDNEEFTLRYINFGTLSVSELSTLESRKEVANYGSFIIKMYDNVATLLWEPDEKKYEKRLKRAQKHESNADKQKLIIRKYLSELSKGDLSYKASMRIHAMMKIIEDLENIGDTIFEMSRRIRDKHIQKVWFTPSQRDSLSNIFDEVREALQIMVDNLLSEHRAFSISDARNKENKINQLRDSLLEKHIIDLKEKKYKTSSGMYYREIFFLTEKIGDYAYKVSEALFDSKD